MTGQSRGLALIQFGNREDAQAAMEALDGSIFQGRLLHILPARPPPMAESSKVRPPCTHLCADLGCWADEMAPSGLTMAADFIPSYFIPDVL